MSWYGKIMRQKPDFLNRFYQAAKHSDMVRDFDKNPAFSNDK